MKAPIIVAAELRLALANVQRGEHVKQLIDAGEAGIQTIARMIKEFHAEMAKALATGGYWPMDTAPKDEGDRILGLVQRGHAGGRVVVEPRVLVRKDGRWCSLPGGWTTPVLGWRPVPAEDIVTEHQGPATW